MLEFTPLEHLLDEIGNLPVSEAARAGFVRILREMAGSRLYLAHAVLIRPERIALAQKLLDDGLTVAEVRSALQDRRGIGRRVAYRMIALALAKRFRDRQMGLFADAYVESDKHA
jgi:hypothetical protein